MSIPETTTEPDLLLLLDHMFLQDHTDRLPEGSDGSVHWSKCHHNPYPGPIPHCSLMIVVIRHPSIYGWANISLFFLERWKASGMMIGQNERTQSGILLFPKQVQSSSRLTRNRFHISFFQNRAFAVRYPDSKYAVPDSDRPGHGDQSFPCPDLSHPHPSRISYQANSSQMEDAVSFSIGSSRGQTLRNSAIYQMPL